MRPVTLKAFFASALVVLATPATAEWEFHQNVDEITDEKRESAITFRDRVGIIITCFRSSKDLQATVHMGDFLNTKFDPVSVTYRVDKGAPENPTWKAYDGNQTYSSDYMAEMFARKLITGKVLVFRAEDYQGYDHTEKFDLTGAAGPIRKVLTACGEK